MSGALPITSATEGCCHHGNTSAGSGHPYHTDTFATDVGCGHHDHTFASWPAACGRTVADGVWSLYEATGLIRPIWHTISRSTGWGFMIEKTEEGFKAFLAARADFFWKNGEQPYHLSLVAGDLKAEGVNYKDILGDEKLKAFVARTSDENGYRLVEHPLKKPKIGIVPADAKFEFTDIPPLPRSSPNPKLLAPSSQDRAVLDFLQVLSKLDDADLDTVIIPTRVFVKLLGRK